eukprot:9483126-Heterocapsa_arctica.AAC.1
MGVGGWIVGAFIAASTVSLDRLYVSAPPNFLDLVDSEPEFFTSTRTPSSTTPEAEIEAEKDEETSFSFFRRR